MKKILIEIITMTIAYVFLSSYGYFNSVAKSWSWLISAIIVTVLYGFFKLIEYLHKKKRNSKKEPPQLEK